MENNLYFAKKITGPVKYNNVYYGNVESNESPLIVNVAGCINTPKNHQNLNKIGRKDYYLLYVIQGTLKGLNPDGRATINAGEVVVMPPKKSYCFDCYADEVVYFLCVHFTGSQALEKLQKYGIQIFPNINKLNSVHNIPRYFKSIFDVLASENDFRVEESSILLERLFVEMARSIKNKENEEMTLKKSIRYINENYTTEIKITDLAKMENMCMTAYDAAFKKQLGISPIKYIINLRIQFAKELLETSNISVKEISLMSGYGNFNYFSRIFKEYVSMSPSEYRKRKSL